MAAGDGLIIFTANANAPPTTRFATLDTYIDAETPTNEKMVLDFDPGATTEFAVFTGVMPGQYDDTAALEVVLHWTNEAATAGDVKWDVSWLAAVPGTTETDSTGWAAIASTTTTGSTGRILTQTVIDFTRAAADSVLADNTFWLRVERDSADAGDTLDSNDAELHTVTVRVNA